MVRAYTAWQSAPTLLLAPNGHAETDLIQIRNIEGLGPAKASVNTSPIGSVDGDSYVGSKVGSRNIVLTLHPNPDWVNWMISDLRDLFYKYFLPKMPTRLVFESDNRPPVEISGYVETVEPTPFSRDPETQISIICPYPYFTTVDPFILTGVSTDMPLEIEYDGSVETGINVEISHSLTPIPTLLGVQIGDPSESYFRVAASVSSSMYLSMSSLPGQKYVQNIAQGSGVITNLLSKVQEGSEWPNLQPGLNQFSVVGDKGVQDWRLTYFERFGGL